MTAALGAEKGVRSADRLGYRSGYYGCSLVTPVGTPRPARQRKPDAMTNLLKTLGTTSSIRYEHSNDRRWTKENSNIAAVDRIPSHLQS